MIANFSFAELREEGIEVLDRHQPIVSTSRSQFQAL